MDLALPNTLARYFSTDPTSADGFAKNAAVYEEGARHVFRLNGDQMMELCVS